jgi:O-acetyl-ADP-ribose deacetylase (regulator of RNase III)
MGSCAHSYGYPLIPAAEVACEEVRKYLEGENGSKVSISRLAVHARLHSHGVSVPGA